MNTQPKSKTLVILIAILLVTNVALLAILLTQKPQKKYEHKSMMGAYLKNEIGFSPDQMLHYDSLRAQHRRQVKSLFEEVRGTKIATFKALGNNAFCDSSIQVAASESVKQQENIERVMLMHLKNIRNICTSNQQAIFDTSFYKIMQRGRVD